MKIRSINDTSFKKLEIPNRTHKVLLEAIERKFKVMGAVRKISYFDQVGDRIDIDDDEDMAQLQNETVVVFELNC